MTSSSKSITQTRVSTFPSNCYALGRMLFQRAAQKNEWYAAFHSQYDERCESFLHHPRCEAFLSTLLAFEIRLQDTNGGCLLFSTICSTIRRGYTGLLLCMGSLRYK